MVGMSKAKAEKKPLPKRFYAAVEAQQNAEGFCILLDGKSIKTPTRKMLQVASAELAQQMVEEWASQIDVIDTDTMPLTRLVHIMLDRIEIDRAALRQEIVEYAGTDLLCYRVPMSPETEELRRAQDAAFDPVLHWAEAQHGLRFVLTEGLMPVPQPEASLQKISTLFAAAKDGELAALSMLLPILGSALLVLAVWHGHITIEEALIAARLDEAAAEARYGVDLEMAAKWADKCRDARAAAFFLTCNQQN